MALTHYEVLGVDQDATRAEITSAFRAQMRALHADAGGDDELAKNVSSAFNVLSNAAKRAAYDRTLTQQPRPRTSGTGAAGTTSSPSPAAAAARETVFTAGRGSPSFSMMNADPSAWSWHDPAGDDENIAEGSSAGRRSVVRTVGLILAFLAWAAAGAAAASTLGLPLARLELVSLPWALVIGAGIHLVWSILMITHAVLHRAGTAVSLGLALAAAVAIYLDAGTPLPTLGALLCLAATMVTTFLSFGTVLPSAGEREGSGIIDSSFITQVGATTIGDRHPEIDQLLGVLHVAFSHRRGVRLILLPDRVTPRNGSSPVRTQVAVVVGRTVHLIAIPSLGSDGLEISGSQIVSDGAVHRNVVRDEAQALTTRYGRSGRAYGYVIPTRLAIEPPTGTQAHGVTFASLTQVVDTIARDAGADLDTANASFRRQALESMSLLV